MKYLTAEQYLLSDSSIPSATSMSTQELNRWILRAEALIDTYCGFDARLGGFEQHQSWYQLAFDNETLRTRIPNFPVPIIQVLKYQIQVSNQTGGAGFFATIDPSDCVINVYGGYVEIVPLQAITYSAAPFVIGLGLRPPLVQINYEAGFYFGSTGEQLVDQNGDQTLYRAIRGFWTDTYNLATYIQPLTLPPTPHKIYINGVAQSPAAYTLNMTEGTVTFNATPQPTDVITADYTYTIPDPVREAMVAQVSWMLSQRALNLLGLGSIEVARNRDQQIKRHIRASQGASNKDEPAIDAWAMQLLEPYTYIPVG